MDEETIEKRDDGLYRQSADGVSSEKLSVIEAIDFYLGQIAQFGPERKVGAYHLAYPERQLRWLCVEASESDIARRPQAVVHATRAWLLDLEKLETTIVRRRADQVRWRLAWDTLDHHVRALEIETSELRARLDRLREPPPPTPDGLSEEEEERAFVLAMMSNDTSKKPA